MPRKTPTTGLTVVAIGVAKTRALQLMSRDGLDDAEQECLLLFDHASYLAEKADHDRRKAHNREDYGDVTPRLRREARELDDEYAHVLKQAA